MQVSKPCKNIYKNFTQEKDRLTHQYLRVRSSLIQTYKILNEYYKPGLRIALPYK